jgi:hypothetical protein
VLGKLRQPTQAKTVCDELTAERCLVRYVSRGRPGRRNAIFFRAATGNDPGRYRTCRWRSRHRTRIRRIDRRARRPVAGDQCNRLWTSTRRKLRRRSSADASRHYSLRCSCTRRTDLKQYMRSPYLGGSPRACCTDHRIAPSDTLRRHNLHPLRRQRILLPNNGRVSRGSRWLRCKRRSYPMRSAARAQNTARSRCTLRDRRHQPCPRSRRRDRSLRWTYCRPSPRSQLRRRRSSSREIGLSRRSVGASRPRRQAAAGYCLASERRTSALASSRANPFG